MIDLNHLFDISHKAKDEFKAWLKSEYGASDIRSAGDVAFAAWIEATAKIAGRQGECRHGDSAEADALYRRAMQLRLECARKLVQLLEKS